MSRYETLELRRDTDLLWLVLNRPASLNAMNSLLVHELHTASRRTAHRIRLSGWSSCVARAAAFVLDLILNSQAPQPTPIPWPRGCGTSAGLPSWRLRFTVPHNRLLLLFTARPPGVVLPWLWRAICALLGNLRV